MNNDIKGIHAYVYNNKRHPVGVLAAQPSTAKPNEVIIGWSYDHFLARAQRYFSNKHVIG